MRLADLSERSQVSLATIKYYLREGLLAPGRRINATQAEYDESHLRRLRLVRAMIQVGRIPVATVREVLTQVDDDSLGRAVRLGAALWTLPRATEPDPDDPATAAAREEVDRLLAGLGWNHAAEISGRSPVYRELVSLVASLHRLGYPLDAAELIPYARQMEQTALHDLDRMERLGTPVEQVEMAVAGAVLFEPVLLSLRRLAQEQHTIRRFGFED
ncbi:MerR family transcriptional regulator [Streptomyces sp. G-G2]|uniref:MerR family transcriptional regulator n=1 Tax=Streptomyces sp. G-G2 TaxID=3046201 RepID=UPI0024BA7576|nr:MerR family transcriptional regulator [Streptomyces sp. G-G2]MDJ0381196.1 MerR family transcriptional regulator [Streptomyces sp. G-G2]